MKKYHIKEFETVKRIIKEKSEGWQEVVKESLRYLRQYPECFLLEEFQEYQNEIRKYCQDYDKTETPNWEIVMKK